ncbi:THAP domain-containing protein 2-like [Maniola jurtina]|uniref:THAP domain-containing protein 2-like n=1 Tax=Maniola jurtina TaxID=191418 RepID=UPI001E68C77E|nr:THAP domain-containing protein 2-like [Maniola jurtina]
MDSEELKAYPVVKMSKRGRSCCVWGCLNTSVNNPSLAFFSLPTNVKRRKMWLQLISRRELIDRKHVSYRVCEIHFDKKFIQQRNKRRILNRRALPDFNLTDKDNPLQQQNKDIQFNICGFPKTTADASVQTDNHPVISRSVQTLSHLIGSSPLGRQLKLEISTCKRKINSSETKKGKRKTFTELCDRFLTKELSEIVKAQLQLKYHSPGNRYSMEYKKFCSSLYNISPKAYNFMQRSIRLPSRPLSTRKKLAKCESNSEV